MVHTILFASAFVALIATVSAIPMPGGSVVDIDGGDYIGTDTIDLDYLLADAISAQNVEVKSNYFNCIVMAFTNSFTYRCRPRC